MTTRRIYPNNDDAQLPTGLLIAEGKPRSARNALRDRLMAKNPFLSEEDREEYKRHCASYFVRFAGREECARDLVQRIADIEWRLQRVSYLESALMEAGEFAALANIVMYHQRLQRTKYRGLGHLRNPLALKDIKKNL